MLRDARVFIPAHMNSKKERRGRKQDERRLGRSMKYGKKDSGHERKSPEGLAILGCRKYPTMSSADLN